MMDSPSWSFLEEGASSPFSCEWDYGGYNRFPLLSEALRVDDGSLELECSSQNSVRTRVTMSPSKAYAYSVKVMNPARRSSHTVKKLEGVRKKFMSIQEIRDDIVNCLHIQPCEIGYISPGHGLKGKQNSLTEDDDINVMYTQYKKKREIMLSCVAEHPENAVPQDKLPRKRKHPEEPGSKEAESTSEPKITVPEIAAKLKEKHGSKFTVERFSAWANMIDLGKHASYDEPPDMPYFGRKKAKQTSSSSSVPPAVPQAPTPPSPGRRIRYRGECMEQLSKWHSLLETGIITEEQYKELQSTILADIANL